MATEQFDRLAKKATESLGKLQQFDPNTVARVEELGPLSFLPAVEPVRKLISFWQLINPAGLGDLSQTALRNIVERADSDLSLLERFKTFSVNDGVNARAQIIAEAENSFDATFDQLHSQAGFTASRRFDFSGELKSAQAAATALRSEMEAQKAEAEKILAAMRTAAAEEGVSQHARHFKDEGDLHEAAAKAWLSTTVVFTVLLLLYAVAILLFRNAAFLKAHDSLETAQLVLGKTLIFATLSFFLVFASRSYLSNRHNVVVNRHRQNALSTYTELVRAAGEEANRDIILTKAAECIFSAQPTGFSKSDGSDAGHMSLISVGQAGLKQ